METSNVIGFKIEHDNFINGAKLYGCTSYMSYEKITTFSWLIPLSS